MGFFNKLRKKVRGQIVPVMPRRGGFLGGMPQTKPLITDMRFRGRMPQKITGLSGLFRRLQEQLRNQQMRMPQPIPERMSVSNVPSFNPTIFGQPIRRDMDFSQMPQISPEDMRNLQIPTEMPVMPEERMAPPVMNQMQGPPRMMMAAGGPSVVGRALSQRFKNPSNAVLGVRGRNLPDRMMPGIGDRILGSPGLNDRLRRGTENAIIAGGAGGAALLADGTQMFREPFSKENARSFMSPEAFGKDMAQMRMDVGAVINFARNKANEVGANINEYVSRARSAYDQEMENQRMQELDAEQGMQPFSMLMGPDMPLFRPEETDPRVNRMIESGRGRTVSDMDRESLDDILSDLEKKN